MGNHVYLFSTSWRQLSGMPFLLLLLLEFLFALEDHLSLELHVPYFSLRWDIQWNFFLRC